MVVSRSRRLCAALALALALTVAFACVSAHVAAYVYPLPATAGAGTTLGGRTQAMDVPRAFAAQSDPNALLSTPAYTAWGAKISTARYTHNAQAGTFTRVAAEDCADILNQRLIDGDYAIAGHDNARGLRSHLPAFNGMVALSVVNDSPGPGRHIYWTVSSNAPLTVNEIAAFTAANDDMNRWQAAAPIDANDVWQFVDPFTDLIALAAGSSSVAQCSAHTVPAGKQAAPPTDPTPAYTATQNVPSLAAVQNPQTRPAGFPALNNGAAWTTATINAAWPAFRKAQREQGDSTGVGRTRGAPFCFTSHPFEAFRYEQQAGSYNNGGGAVRRSYARMDETDALLEGSILVNGATPVGIPTCNCAGSRLASFLHHLGVFAAPGPYVPPAGERRWSKGHPEPEDLYHARKTARTKYEARLKANARVRCFSEARSFTHAMQGVAGRNPGYEVNTRQLYDTRPTAASCATCQVQIQLIYGNTVAAACGDGTALANAVAEGATVWANSPAAEQSLSFVSVDDKDSLEAAADAELQLGASTAASQRPSAPHGAGAAAAASADAQHARLLQSNASPMHTLRRKIKA